MRVTTGLAIPGQGRQPKEGVMSWSILLKALPILVKLVPELRGRKRRRKMEKLLRRWVEAMEVVEDSGMDNGSDRRASVLKALEMEFSDEMGVLPESRKNLITEILLPFIRGEADDEAGEYDVDLRVEPTTRGHQRITGRISRS